MLLVDQAFCLLEMNFFISAVIHGLSLGTGLKITGDRSPVKMTGQLDFSSVKICFLSVTDTLTLTVKQTIRNLFRYIIVSCFNSRRQQSHWKA